MLYNLVLNVCENVLLTIVWDAERHHNAYWHLVATHPINGSVIQQIDGPFPNQYMAAADIFKRFSSLDGFRVVALDGQTIPIEEKWKERYGVNFKRAFTCVPPSTGEIEGVYVAVLVK